MKLMSDEEVKKHKENPNIFLKVAGKPFSCKCGCNLFHHPGNDSDVYQCNGCPRVYTATER